MFSAKGHPENCRFRIQAKGKNSEYIFSEACLSVDFLRKGLDSDKKNGIINPIEMESNNVHKTVAMYPAVPDGSNFRIGKRFESMVSDEWKFQ